MADNTKNLWQKLFEIQKQLKTFAVKEESDKRDPNGKPTYRYTPGWEITEKVRDLMDAKGIMLTDNVRKSESKLIEYLVYKDFHGQAMSFTKKEMFVEVTVEFTWVDTQTGEQLGPYTGIGYGANGTDKSGATALTMAKRYFLMNFFHFTTRELNDEQDAHDSGNIPGIASGENGPKDLTSGQAVQAIPAPAPFVPGNNPAQPQQTVMVQPVLCPVPGFGGLQTAAPGAGMPMGFQNGPVQAPGPNPQYRPSSPTGEFNESDPAIQIAITALMNYNKNTPSHQRVLNEHIGRLCNMGYAGTSQEFINRLVETAQSIREGKRR